MALQGSDCLIIERRGTGHRPRASDTAGTRPPIPRGRVPDLSIAQLTEAP